MDGRIARSRTVVRKAGAESHGYCVREFDRCKARGGEMSEEQKKYDIHFTGVAYDPKYPVKAAGRNDAPPGRDVAISLYNDDSDEIASLRSQ